MKVTYWWKLSCDESYLVMKVILWWKFCIFLLLIQICNILPFSYISIICSLHLHKFLYDSQIHNILTCVNTLHFSESSFFFILCVWRFAWCRSWGVWYIVYPTRFGINPTRNITFTFSVLYDSFFQSTIPPNPTLKKMHFCYTFSFSFIYPTLSHPIQLLKLFCIS